MMERKIMEYEKIFQKVKQTVSNLWGDQTGISYPVPGVMGGIAVETFFLYPTGNQLNRARPFGLLTVSAENGRVMQFADCAIQDFVDTAKHPLGSTISYALDTAMDVNTYREKQQQIRQVYIQARTAAFSGEALAEEYGTLVKALSPAALMDYYQAIGM